MDGRKGIRSAKCFPTVSEAADKIVKDDADSVQAIQTNLSGRKLAYDKQDYAAAEKALKKVENSKVKDAGLTANCKIRFSGFTISTKEI